MKFKRKRGTWKERKIDSEHRLFWCHQNMHFSQERVHAFARLLQSVVVPVGGD